MTLFAVLPVSPTLFDDPGIPKRLMALLREYNLRPQMLALDITHMNLGAFTAEMLDVLLRLRAFGFQLVYEFDELSGETMNHAFAASVTTIGLRPPVFETYATDDAGCDFLDGDFISSPIAAEDVGSSVQAN